MYVWVTYYVFTLVQCLQILKSFKRANTCTFTLNTFNPSKLTITTDRANGNMHAAPMASGGDVIFNIILCKAK